MRRSYGAVQQEASGADHDGQTSREIHVKSFRFKVFFRIGVASMVLM
jgi:hypothetical protein